MDGALAPARLGGWTRPAQRCAWRSSASAFAEWLSASPFAAEVTPTSLVSSRWGSGAYATDARPKKLEWMIRQAGRLGR